MDILENQFLRIETTAEGAAIDKIIWKSKNRCVTLQSTGHLKDPSFSGNTIGMISGRVHLGKIGGYTLPLNDGERPNTLHGGDETIAKKIWKRDEIGPLAVSYSITMLPFIDALPGKRKISAVYDIDGPTLNITYTVTSDSPTLSNLTNHVYFNLSGKDKTIAHHLIHVDSTKMRLCDRFFMPSIPLSLKGSAMDLARPKRISSLLERSEVAICHGLNNPYILSGERKVSLQSNDLLLEATGNSQAVILYSGAYLPHPMSHLAIEFQDLNDTLVEKTHDERTISFTFRDIQKERFSCPIT